jgi:elongation factor G
MKDKVKEYRAILVEKVSEHDDALNGKIFRRKRNNIPEIKVALRKATIQTNFIRFYAEQHLQNMGVQLLLDAICNTFQAHMTNQISKEQTQKLAKK